MTPDVSDPTTWAESQNPQPTTHTVTFSGGRRHGRGGRGRVQPVSIHGEENASLQAAGDVIHPHHRRLVLPDAAQPVGAQAAHVAGQDQRALWETRAEVTHRALIPDQR